MAGSKWRRSDYHQGCRNAGTGAGRACSRVSQSSPTSTVGAITHCLGEGGTLCTQDVRQLLTSTHEASSITH